MAPATTAPMIGRTGDRVHWCLQDRRGQLWHDDGRGKGALELFVAERDAEAAGSMPAIERRAFVSLYPYGYPIPARPTC